MKTGSTSFDEGMAPAIRETAARWRARRDQGLTALEEEEFFAWLDADERHAIACGDLEATIERLGGLRALSPAVPVPVAPPPAVVRGPRRRFWMAVTATAAALAVGLFRFSREPAEFPPAPTIASTRTYDLPDGSVIETNLGGRVQFAYTGTERRVRLVSGEAHFTVAKHQRRAFIVEANGLTVRAVGTAFDVRLQPRDVQVLVTEGKVEVHAPAGAPVPPESAVVYLDAGHRVTVPFDGPPSVLDILPVSADAIDEVLSWRSRALVFNDATLAEVVAAFNRRNAHQLVIDDRELADRRFGGTFRPDAYEAVVRLLEADFGVTAERQPGRTVLRRSH